MRARIGGFSFKGRVPQVVAAFVLVGCHDLPLSPSVRSPAAHHFENLVLDGVSGHTLSLPPDAVASWASVIADGIIFGYVTTASSITWGVMWGTAPGAVATVLPTLPNTLAHQALGGNAAGTAVGTVFLSPSPCAVGAGCPVVWQNGVATLLTRPSGYVGGFATAVNIAGVIVGSLTASGGRLDPVVWVNGVPAVLPLLDISANRTNRPEDINASGLVVGAASVDGSSRFAAKWENGTAAYLPIPLGAIQTAAHAVNDAGVIVGGGEWQGVGGGGHPIRWTGGTAERLPRPDGSTSCIAWDINASGDIAGWCSVSGMSRTILWKEGSIFDLGPADIGARGISNQGVVIGSTLNGCCDLLGIVRVPSFIVPGATPSGTDVLVQPNDATTGQPAPVTMTFSTVTSAGETSVASGSVGGGSGAPPPSGFRLGTPPRYYDITTTAAYVGAITVCIDYTSASFGNESHLQLLHREASGQWVNVTTSHDPATNTICGSVTSLSPFLVAELNVAPAVNAITLPVNPLAIGTTIGVTAVFSDANTFDTHSACVAWDDGVTTAAQVSESGGSGSATASHAYGAAGVYTVGVTASDGALSGSRSSDQDIPSYVVVYDPSAGFVTGGGWIMSPAGAYAPNPDLVGKAHFGFVSKYSKGSIAPTGNTEFQFEQGLLSFSSTNYQWLVVAGARAQFKGVGSINGTGGYGFLLTAIDGQTKGGGGFDRFRIKIWNPSGAVVYDNQRDAAEDSSASTVLGGGAIVIHP